MKDGKFMKQTLLSEIQERVNQLERMESEKDDIKKQLAEKHAKFYIIDAVHLAREIGLGNRTNTILQSAFFKLNEQIMPYETAQDLMKKYAAKTYGKKGEEIVKLNYLAIDKGGKVKRVPVKPEWKDLEVIKVERKSDNEYFDDYVEEINHLRGYDLPVSAFTKENLLNGSMQPNITYNEKRTIATEVPHWHKENCIQCGKCVIVCPHATIRAFLATEEEVANAPLDGRDDVIPALGPNMAGLKFKIQVSPDNCVGCGLCVAECPGKAGKKALTMEDVKHELHQSASADYYYQHIPYRSNLLSTNTFKGASLLKPYFEISGACAGCGETPYYRLISQLFGKDMLVGNATGCSSIYCGSVPSTPFVKDENGEGPAWANSLFEDNAEYAYGMRVATDIKLNDIRNIILENMDGCEDELKEVLNQYLENQNNREVTRGLKDRLLSLVTASSNQGIKALLDYSRDLVNKSVWSIGGDGWAYDIGYGGLDHVLACNENINILVLDTEVYSNTGGQASKSTQTGAIAKFAAAGKKTAKKDLASIAMAYGHVYVAQISMGANINQTIKALKEAEAYNGPSLIIAYSPCIEHGIKGGLINHQKSQRDATECGYWPIFRFDPRLEAEGKNPLQIDCKEPNFDKYFDYILSQTRYNQLPKINPENAQALLDANKAYSMRRWNKLKKMAE